MTFRNRVDLAVRGVLLTLAAGVLAACAAGSAESDLATTAPTPDATADILSGMTTSTTPTMPSTQAVIAAQLTPASTQETGPAPEVLRIWWPEPLARVDQPELLAEGGALAALIEAFVQAEAGVFDIDFRLKSATGPGSIMATLSSASMVAPSALPDVTLLRREDLLLAVQQGLALPLESYLATGVTDTLYAVALDLSQVNGQLYGLPYMLDVLHLIHRDPAAEDWTFGAILGRGDRLLFPAARANSVNNTFLAQYLAAGGSLSEDGSTLVVDHDALLTVLEFYEAAVEAGLVNASLLDYTTPADYAPLLAESEVELPYDAVAVTSGLYLRLMAEGQAWYPAPIAADSGEGPVFANGWMWVITSPDPERRELAGRFITWMMDFSRQRDYAAAIAMLPSQPAAMTIDAPVLSDFLQTAVPVIPEAAGGSAARAMQNALIAVLTGTSSAEDAAAAAVASVGGSA